MEIQTSLVDGERVNKQESSPHRLSSSGTGKGPRSPTTGFQGQGQRKLYSHRVALSQEATFWYPWRTCMRTFLVCILQPGYQASWIPMM